MRKLLFAWTLLAIGVQGVRMQTESLKSDLDGKESNAQVQPWHVLMPLLLAFNPSPSHAFAVGPGAARGGGSGMSTLGSTPAASRGAAPEMIDPGSKVRVVRPKSYWSEKLGTVEYIATADDRSYKNVVLVPSNPVVVRFDNASSAGPTINNFALDELVEVEVSPAKAKKVPPGTPAKAAYRRHQRRWQQAKMMAATNGTGDLPPEGLVLGEFPLKRLRVPQGSSPVGSPVAVDVAVGNDKFTAMLDTALSTIAVTPEKAASWNAVSQGAVSVQGSSDAKQLDIVRAPSEIKLLGSDKEVSLPALDAMVSSFPQARMDPEVPIDAMIGLPPLWDRFDVDIDFRSGAGVLRLYKIGDGAAMAEAKGMTGLQVSPLPFSGLPAVRVITPDGQALLGLVDTGSTMTIANTEAAKLLIPGVSFLGKLFSPKVEIADTGLGLKLAPGVPLPLGDLRGVSEDGKFTAAGEVKPKFIATGEVPALTQFAGAGRPAVIIGMDVLRGKRLLFTGGDQGASRTLFVE